MAMAQFELYHGAVLAQIVRNPKINVKLFERNNDHGWGVYEITDNQNSYLVVIKSTAQIRKGRKGGCACSFVFSASDIERLRKIKGNVLLCLVCSDEEICVLEWEDVDFLGLLIEKEACAISVSWEKGSGLHVKCKRQELNRVVPRNKLRMFEWV